MDPTSLTYYLSQLGYDRREIRKALRETKSTNVDEIVMYINNSKYDAQKKKDDEEQEKQKQLKLEEEKKQKEQLEKENQEKEQKEKEKKEQEQKERELKEQKKKEEIAKKKLERKKKKKKQSYSDSDDNKEWNDSNSYEYSGNDLSGDSEQENENENENETLKPEDTETPTPYPNDFENDDDGLDVLIAEEKKKIKTSVLTEDELIRKQEKLISKVSEIIDRNYEETRLLLRKNQWNEEKFLSKYFANPQTTCQEAGIKYTGKSTKKKISSFMCGICGEDFEDNPDEMFALDCGHAFCKDCWRNYLNLKIKEAQVGAIPCPGFRCQNKVSSEVIRSIVTEGTFKQYIRFQAHSFVEENPDVKWCPAPGCGRAVHPSQVQFHMVKCDCGHRYCFECQEEPHGPATCQQVEEWKKRINEGKKDTETDSWMNENTKPCPKCKVLIEKNGGCNHMTCYKCHYEFCWICLDPWAGHTSYYTCLAKGTEILIYRNNKIEIEKVENVKNGDLLVGDDETKGTKNQRLVSDVFSHSGKLYQITQSNADPYSVNEHHLLSLRLTKNPQIVLLHNEIFTEFSWMIEYFDPKTHNRKYVLNDVFENEICQMSQEKMQKYWKKQEYFDSDGSFFEKESKELGIKLDAKMLRKLQESFYIVYKELKRMILKGKTAVAGDVIDISVRNYIHKKTNEWKELHKGFQVSGFCEKQTILFDPYSFAFELALSKATNFLPENVVYNSPEIQAKALAGLMDSMAQEEDGEIVFHFSVLDPLVDDVCFLCKSLGLVSKQEHYFDKNQKSSRIQVSISGRKLKEIPIRNFEIKNLKCEEENLQDIEIDEVKYNVIHKESGKKIFAGKNHLLDLVFEPNEAIRYLVGVKDSQKRIRKLQAFSDEKEVEKFVSLKQKMEGNGNYDKNNNKKNFQLKGESFYQQKLEEKEGSLVVITSEKNFPNNLINKTEFSSYIAIEIQEYLKLSTELKSTLKSFYYTKQNGLNCQIRKEKREEIQVQKSINGEGRYYGITVDGDKRFLLKDFTVTHNCNRYEKAKENEAKLKKELNYDREDERRYNHHFDRYQNHSRSLEFENRMLKKVSQDLQRMKPKDPNYRRVTTIRDALDVLIDNRYSLKYSYVFGYYCPRGTVQDLFLFMQTDLEKSTEDLSHSIEHLQKVDTIYLQNLTKLASSRRYALLEILTDIDKDGNMIYIPEQKSTNRTPNQSRWAEDDEKPQIKEEPIVEEIQTRRILPTQPRTRISPTQPRTSPTRISPTQTRTSPTQPRTRITTTTTTRSTATSTESVNPDALERQLLNNITSIFSQQLPRMERLRTQFSDRRNPPPPPQNPPPPPQNPIRPPPNNPFQFQQPPPPPPRQNNPPPPQNVRNPPPPPPPDFFIPEDNNQNPIARFFLQPRFWAILAQDDRFSQYLTDNEFTRKVATIRNNLSTLDSFLDDQRIIRLLETFVWN
ncbi:intein-containing e3 ubiquitin-protein ligase ari5-related precursor [Anaeramoeba ignava]|uniref:RBR-type E3 ubiquitin transferase n=1 Tax=Anaeramoeba ignava TaxID=1746090 RepID=A0A9Q0LSI5_ANAIG|nr:intein-containing e3 ubiquitin-protein ligase ari5-related precursor [Anaeramoeba ignava]